MSEEIKVHWSAKEFRTSILDHAPFLLASARIGFPKPDAPEICIPVVPRFYTRRQAFESLGIATTEHHVISNKRTLQLPDRMSDFAFPSAFAKPCQAGL